jgi:hypothetical protein
MSCPGCPIQTDLICYCDLLGRPVSAHLFIHVLFRLICQADQTRLACPAHMSRLFCPGCPVLSRLFCPRCPIPKSYIPVLLSELSLPCSHTLAVLSTVSCPGCNILTAIPGCPVPANLSQHSFLCPSFPVLAVQLSCPRCPVFCFHVLTMFELFCRSCPVPHALC